MICNITLSFDEALTQVTLPDPDSVEGALASSYNQNSSTQAQPVFLQTDPPNSSQQSGSDGGKSFILGKVPISAEVELPGYRQAGSFHATFDYSELPIDPRCIRSAAVEIHLGTVSHRDFAEGMQGRRADGSLSSILTPRRDDSYFPNSSTVVMVATVDEWHVDHNENGSVAILSGRDLRGALIDTPIGIVPGATQTLFDMLDMNQPIDAIVVQILRFHPFFQDFQVVVNPAEWDKGIVPSPANSDVVPRHRKPAKAHVRKNNQPTAKIVSRVNSKSNSKDMSFWDLIVRVCFLVGAIPYFRGVKLFIRPARTAFDQVRMSMDPVRNPTPFRNGQPRSVDLISGAPMQAPLKVRRLVYGRDVTSYGFDRKFAGFHRPRVIRVVGYDASAPNGQRDIQARWPPEEDKPAKVTSTSPSGKVAQEEIMDIPIGDVKDPTQIEAIAQGIYEEIGRGEIGGSVTTENLSSFGGDNTDPDLLRLAPGDGVELMVDTRDIHTSSTLTSTLTDLNRLAFSDAVKRLAPKLGNDRNLAAAIIGTQRGQFAELQRFFRVANVSYNWTDEGVKISFDYQNYVVPRNQVKRADATPGQLTSRQVPGSGKTGLMPKAGPNNHGGLSSITGRR